MNRIKQEVLDGIDNVEADLNNLSDSLGALQDASDEIITSIFNKYVGNKGIFYVFIDEFSKYLEEYKNIIKKIK